MFDKSLDKIFLRINKKNVKQDKNDNYPERYTICIMDKEIKEKKPLKLSDWLKMYIFLNNFEPNHPPKIYKHSLKNLVDKPVRPFQLAKGRTLHRYKIPHWMQIIERQSQ